MKVLGKKRQENAETIEAYDLWGCADIVSCSSSCATSSSGYASVNTALYNYMKNNRP